MSYIYTNTQKQEIESMQVTVEGQHINVGDALRTHVEEKIEDIIGKYFNRATDADVKFSREGHAFIKVHISIRVGHDIMVMADDVETDAYAAFDIAAARIAKQLRRYKRKLRDHHDRPENASLKARGYVLAPQNTEEEQPKANEADKQAADFDEAAVPPVIAEISTEIQTLSVSDAVMRMDLTSETALLFRNAKTDRLNMVYRRKDGNIGWVDPEMTSNGGVSSSVATG